MKMNKISVIGILGVVLGGIGTMFCSAASLQSEKDKKEMKEEMKEEIKQEVLKELKD